MSKDNSAKDSPQERRQFYRIDDQIIFHYKIVPESESVLRLRTIHKDRPDSFNLSAKFSAMSLRSGPLLRDITAQSPAIAKYLSMLDNKLDMLAQVLFEQDDDVMGDETLDVNLSASGMAFRAQESFTTGQVLELRLVLLPSYTGIHCYGKVIHCEPVATIDDKGSHRLAVEFIEISEEDSDLIAKHVFNKQSNRQRQLRQENTQGPSKE